MEPSATVPKESHMNRLENIANRQRRSRARDVVFACFIALIAVVGATTVGATIHGAITHVATR
jgi:beta-lactamase regulating signal transducer with metallopeptidase domain